MTGMVSGGKGCRWSRRECKSSAACGEATDCASPQAASQQGIIRMPVKTLTINGKQLSARAEQTILEVAEEAGIRIPTLCRLQGVHDVGACRLCLIEVEGSGRLLPACVTRVHENMIVTTHTPRLQEYRKMIVELLFAERNHICAICVANNHC